MESLDLHPEELFDKQARGVASAEELSRIDAHLKSCAACRFERQVRADFDAVTGSADDLDDLVARALSGAAQTESGPPRRSRRVAPLLAAAIALFGVASLAAVAQFTGVLPHLVERITSSGDRTPQPQKTPAPSQQLAPKPEVAPTPEPIPEPTPEPEVIAPVPTPAPVAAVSTKKSVPSAARTAVPAPAPPEPVVATPAPAEVTPEIPVVAEPDALTLFSRAHRERVQGETAAAIRDFRAVIARYPNAREASLANAELGRLLLERGEATSALEAFDAYLASSDVVLREDVLAGRATALEKLGRTAAERSAWEALLRDYPSGVYAPRARTRLESLAP
ncbi:MAG: tetratricopeptide repeat protein [Archangium sp.]